MDYEQKYKEALERAKKLKENPKAIFFEEENIHVSDYIFPELRESEDERIKKEIMEIIMPHTCKTEKEFHRRKELCDWLEKQGQKPAWTKADDEEFEIAINTLKDAGQYDPAAWLITLKQRIGG